MTIENNNPSAVNKDKDVMGVIGHLLSIPPARHDISDCYFDDDIVMKVNLIEIEIPLNDEDNYKKFLKKWEIAQSDEHWNHYYLPIVLYKLIKPFPVDPNDPDNSATTQHFKYIVTDDNRNFEVKYVDGMIHSTDPTLLAAEPKRFHVPKNLWTTKQDYLITMDKANDFVNSHMETEHPYNLYKECKSYIKTYVDANPFTYTATTLWAMGTHLYRIFSRYPYLLFLSPTGSGKTRFMHCILNLCQRGRLLTNPTMASLFRQVHGKGMTLGIDENEGQQKSNHLDMQNLMNATFEEGSVVPRCVSKGKDGVWSVEYFDGYCPKLLGTTEPVFNTLANRSFRIPVVRTKDAKKYANQDPDKDWGRELAWRLDKWVLNCGSEIYGRRKIQWTNYHEVYKELLKEIADPRLNSLMHPLIIIAESIGLHEMEGEIESLKLFMQYQNKRVQSVNLDTIDRRIILALYDVISGKEGKFSQVEHSTTTTEIITALNLDEDDTALYSSTKIGKRLQKLGIMKTATNRGRRYTTSIPEVQDLMERYDIDQSELFQEE